MSYWKITGRTIHWKDQVKTSTLTLTLKHSSAPSLTNWFFLDQNQTFRILQDYTHLNHYSKSRVPKTPSSHHFFNSSSIVSRPWFFPVEPLRPPFPLFFTLATCYVDGNVCVLRSITHTSLTSTVTVSKKRMKHGLMLNSDLMHHEMTDEKAGEQPVVFLTCFGPRGGMKGYNCLSRESDWLTVCSNWVYLSRVDLVTKDHTNPVSLCCHTQAD